MKISRFVSLILEAISEDNEIFSKLKKETEEWREDIKPKETAVAKTINDLSENKAKKMINIIQKSINNIKALMEFEAVKKFIYSLNPSKPKNKTEFTKIMKNQILTGLEKDFANKNTITLAKKILAAYRIIESGKIGREHEANIKSYFTNLLSGIAKVTKSTNFPYPDLIIKSNIGKKISEKIPNLNDNNIWIEVKSGSLTSRQLSDKTIINYGLKSFEEGMKNKKDFVLYLNKNKDKILEVFGLKAPNEIDNIYFNEKKGIVNTLRKVKKTFNNISNKFYYFKKNDQIVYAILSKESGKLKVGTILLELVPGKTFSFRKYGNNFEKLYLSNILHTYKLRN